MKLLLTVVILFFIMQSSSWAESINPELIAYTCFTCHGDIKNNSLISLKGLPAQTIETALKDFKTDKRQATIMNRLAKGFTDEEITTLAQFLAGLKKN